jgi:hypothetical protein
MLNLLPLVGAVLGLIFLAVQYVEPCSDAGMIVATCGFGRLGALVLAVIWIVSYGVAYRITRNISKPLKRLVVCFSEAVGFTVAVAIILFAILIISLKFI